MNMIILFLPIYVQTITCPQSETYTMIYFVNMYLLHFEGLILSDFSTSYEYLHRCSETLFHSAVGQQLHGERVQPSCGQSVVTFTETTVERPEIRIPYPTSWSLDHNLPVYKVIRVDSFVARTLFDSSGGHRTP